MEDRELAKLMDEIEKYEEIIASYRKDPSRIGPDREKLLKIQGYLFNLSPVYLNVQPEKGIRDGISALVSSNLECLAKLLLLDLELESLLGTSAVNRAQERTQGGTQ